MQNIWNFIVEKSGLQKWQTSAIISRLSESPRLSRRVDNTASTDVHRERRQQNQERIGSDQPL